MKHGYRPPRHKIHISRLIKLFRDRRFLTSLLIFFILFASLLTVQAHRNRASTDKADSARQVTTQQITHQQRHVKHQLHSYLKKVTADGTTSVSFYNLGPVAGSPAAKSATARKFYKSGALATSANAHTPEISASTYKLYVAAYLFHLHATGQYTWTPTDEDGFQRMIVNSANDFAEDTIDTYGPVNLDDYLASQHYYSPTFVSGQAAVTTAYSLTLVLKDLAQQKGPFSHAADRQKLLSFMKQQVYRTGIPTGAAAAQKGTVVADKVGFLADTNNDAAIVTLPNGERYILVIMTHGHEQTGFSGFPRMAKITTHVQKLVYNPNLVKNLSK
ncbi:MULTISPECIES: serine hydrolase [Lactobacillaceae]|uniref:serine hydrolase n=1 Tax=Lactobacillaceae TaxID=33958 RepID=UPI0014563B1A|nr:serine hydrolase [Lactobacillus sp. HBUAS51381]NLR08980.1 serine hydrolase [Lactobacillus sp. HBUAS51381]